MATPLFVRFQSTTRGPRGRFSGVFGLANGLARAGKLDEAQHCFWRTSNDWYDANFTNPADVDPTVYDARINPGATAWFKATAVHLIERVTGYLDLLEAHGVGCERVESSNPGRIIYEDEEQIVVIPWPAE
ncbi:hypothetical protein DSC45_14405 [Streptomyces sp. YIM 130001]|uniref:hypothetical protein n=1 Tax=Streptomyces sp. YIM 130001 TaxID=2259644 RepID=UPI000E6489E7|nr:hypothetical protein [Streptomyces sp. YIM 130001]RII16951.1 hypothetical protein DSC45_14405 [Streptomyces sp. YIM 130001]